MIRGKREEGIFFGMTLTFLKLFLKASRQGTLSIFVR
jgi:hypothetical protein